MFQTVKSSFRSSESKMDSPRQCTLHTNTCNYKGILFLTFSNQVLQYSRISEERSGPILNKTKSLALDLCMFNQFQFSNLHISPVREKNTSSKGQSQSHYNFLQAFQLKNKIILIYFISGTVIHHGPVIKFNVFNLPKGTVLLGSAQLQLTGFRGTLQDGQKT